VTGSVTGSSALPSRSSRSAFGPAHDDDLVGRVAARDETAESALAALYDRHSASVLGLARRMLGETAAAEDLLQETFWRVWQHAGQFDPRRSRFPTWVLRIAWNLAASELRRQARRPQLVIPATPHENGDLRLAFELVDPEPEVPEQVWHAQRRRLVIAGLKQLPAAQRQAVQLAYFGGMKQVEIAAVQGAPLTTVKTRLTLGLRKLADYLRNHGLRAFAEDP
jgi:RNA polymerase sigma-70 factor (ECF subfamily)